MPPALAFTASTALLLLVCLFGHWSLFSSTTWAKWDSGAYMQIADSGYVLYHCPAASGYPASAWCGDTGWFAGYPLLLAPLYALGTPQVLTGVVVAWLVDLATLILLWVGFLR